MLARKAGLTPPSRHPYPKWLSGQKGDVLAKRVWSETMAELSFAEVRAILDRLKGNEPKG